MIDRNGKRIGGVRRTSVIVSRVGRMNIRAAAVVFALGALALFGSGASQAADSSRAVAQISHTAGAVVWRPGSDRTVLHDREWLGGSQFIETAAGGFVQIRFRDGTVLRAGSSSSFLFGHHVGDPAQGKTIALRLNRGTYRLITGHDGAPINLQVTTPTTIIRPIGTDYEVRVGSAGTTEVSVREGAVIALATSGRGSRTVEAGKAVTLASNATFQNSPVRFSPDPGLRPRSVAALPLAPPANTGAGAGAAQSLPVLEGQTDVANAVIDAVGADPEAAALDGAVNQLAVTAEREIAIGVRLRRQGIRALNTVADQTRAAAADARAATDRAVSSVSQTQRLAEADLRAARRLLSTTDLGRP